jgi:hypothetical protein
MIRKHWPSRLPQVSTEAELAALVNDYFGAWPFRDLELLPLDCQPLRAIVPDEIPEMSRRVAEESLRLRLESPAHSHLHDLCLFLAHALYKLMQLRA